MKSFPGATFTPAPEYEPQGKQEKRDMFVVWAEISKLSYFDGHWRKPTKIVHADHVEYQHNKGSIFINSSACGPLRVYKDHAEMTITGAEVYPPNGRSYSGTIRYELNSEFYEALNKIEWETSDSLRRSKVVEVTSQMEPIQDLSKIKVGSVLLACNNPTGEYYPECDSYNANHAIILGVTGFRFVDSWANLVGFEHFHPEPARGTFVPEYEGRLYSGGHTWGDTYYDIPRLHRNGHFYLVQEGTGKTWSEHGSGPHPYVPRDVLSRAYATKSLVDDYLRGVGMPSNNRKVEKMLGIGY